MNVEIKKAVKAGNSSAVILPRAWLDKEVRVELVKKTPEIILADALKISERYIKSSRIVGIYLSGSYARGEESQESDIDILIVSSDSESKMIYEGIYTIFLISQNTLKWKLENDLFPVGQMIKEATPLINSEYLNSLEVKVTKKNVKWYINTTEEKLNLIRRILNSIRSKKISDKVIYSLVLRIRTLTIMKRIIENKNYSGKEFCSAIEKISGSKNAYNSYLFIKNNLGDAKSTLKEEAERLYFYLEKQLGQVKKLIN